jgi:hypothetical protein
MSKKTILIFTASPLNAVVTRANAAIESMQELFEQNEKFTLEICQVTTVDDLSKKLNLHEPSIVYFFGHGNREGGLILEDVKSKKCVIPEDKLVAIFKEYTECQYSKLECVFLNACHSELLAKSIAKHVDYTIGMQDKIDSKIVIEFARHFYYCLKLKGNYEHAHRYACKNLSKQDAKKPQLIKKSKVLQKNKKIKPYLQIAFFKKEKNGKFYTFVARLYISQDSVKEICKIENIQREHFKNSVVEILGKITLPETTIELFLSDDLLNEPIENYCLPDDDYPIGKDYELVVRSWERNATVAWLNRCRKYWKKADLQVKLSCYLKEVECFNKTICSRLDKRFMFFVLTSPYSNETLTEFIKAGAPVILWFRNEYLAELAAKINIPHKLLTLPELVRRIRTKLWEQEKPIDELVLLWEDTSRTAPTQPVEQDIEIHANNNLNIYNDL